MPTKAKIFISSAYEDDLRTLRTQLANQIRNAGHEALLFEENFGPWGKDRLQTCIDMVDQSDALVLLIKKRAGGFVTNDKVTATYVEFHKASQQGKVILAFIDTQVKELYDNYVHNHLDERYRRYKEEHYNREPDYIIDLVNDMLREDLSGFQGVLSEVDPFVWGFIYQVRQNTPWLYSLDIALTEQFYEELKAYLSNYLKLGLNLIPIQEELTENAINASEFFDYQQFVMQLVSTMKDGMLSDWKKFLNNLQAVLSGGRIVIREGTFTEEEVGTYEDCSAITVYRRYGEEMELIDFCGSISPDERYSIADENSFVANAYHNEEEKLYYREEKQIIYHTVKVEDYVLCFHYQLNCNWNNDNVNAFENEMNNAIMKPSIYSHFAFSLIGGIRHE